MTTLKQLSYLVALSQELHFRRAAERMNVTQPTLSIQIQELERQLKASLIDRNTNKVLLTPLGREIVDRARAVLSGVEDIKDLAAASQHGFEGTIRIGVPPTTGPYFLPHIVPELHKQYPNLKLYVKEGKPRDLQLELKEGVHDVIVSPLPVTHSDLTVANLFREPLHVVTALDHPFASRTSINRTDLQGESVLAMEAGHHLHDQVIELCEEFRATPLRDYEGTSLDTLRLMVGMGVGIAFLPALYIRSEIGNRGEIAVVKLNATSLYRQIGLVWRTRSVHAGLMRDIANLLRSISREKLPEITVLK